MKDSEILHKAKERIASGKSPYICWAIRAIEKAPFKRRKALIEWVEKMLGVSATYEGWLQRKHPRKYNNMSYDNIRQARMEWLDWMIAYCEKEEAKIK